ncbi:MAG: YqgE/AlgH family protein [Pseudomonadota bacterium]
MANETNNAQDFLAGQLLIAMPNMGDPRFERAVVLICSHDADHAMGVIVNKQLDNVEFDDLLKQLEISPAAHASDLQVRFGGPVQTERGLIIHSLDYRLDATIELGDNLGLTATKDILIDIGGAEPVRAAPQRFFLAVGHAGWSGGQLEQEIAMNAWAHCARDHDIIFDGEADDTWRMALAKLGVTSAMFSSEWASVRSDDQLLN